MKKALLFLLLPLAALGAPCLLRAQSVAINADSSAADPSAILDLKSTIKGFLAPRMTQAQRNGIAAPAVGLLVYQTDGTAGYYCYNGSGWNPIGGSGGGSGGGGSDTSSGGGLKDTLWKVTGVNISNSNSGFVGIGTSTPTYPLTIKTSPAYGFGYGLSHTDGTVTLNTFVGGNSYLDHSTSTPTGGWMGTQSNHPLYLYANGGRPIVTIYPNQNVGIDLLTNTIPINKLQIGDMGVGAALFNGNDIAFGNGTQATGLAQLTSSLQLATTTDMVILPRYAQNTPGNVTITGNFGVNAPAPLHNTFQIGDVSASGYNGNDLAIGNNGQGFGIAQMADKTQIASSANMLMLPASNLILMPGTGHVGVNTNTPQTSLDVENAYQIASLYTTMTKFWSTSADPYHDYSTPTTVPNVSIQAGGDVYALAFDAYSDLRIKNLLGTSDAKKDLQAINSLRIRNYTMKDRLIYGNRRFKKVIAQEVEQVSPELVSKHTDFIPNVYQLTDTVTKGPAGYVLHFRGNHHIGDSARKLRILDATGTMQSFDIVSIPSANQVVVHGGEIKISRVFVYGEQVPDFRTVDYEGLSTLNISATQEISREVDNLKKALAEASENIRVLARAVRRLSRRPTGNRLASSRYTPSTHTKQTKKI